MILIVQCEIILFLRMPYFALFLYQPLTLDCLLNFLFPHSLSPNASHSVLLYVRCNFQASHIFPSLFALHTLLTIACIYLLVFVLYNMKRIGKVRQKELERETERKNEMREKMVTKVNKICHSSEMVFFSWFQFTPNLQCTLRAPSQ